LTRYTRASNFLTAPAPGRGADENREGVESAAAPVVDVVREPGEDTGPGLSSRG
jgi:hypothetical protein